MTREEEIQREADSRWLHDSANNQRFVEACNWADQHPRKGLWDSEKACQIIHEVINSDTIGQYLIFDDENIDFDSELFFDDLLRAMED